jgi:hypothetical protein
MTDHVNKIVQVNKVDNEISILEKTLNALSSIREQQLMSLATRKDFNPFVVEEIQSTLESLQVEKERLKRTDEFGKTKN